MCQLSTHLHSRVRERNHYNNSNPPESQVELRTIFQPPLKVNGTAIIIPTPLKSYIPFSNPPERQIPCSELWDLYSAKPCSNPLKVNGTTIIIFIPTPLKVKFYILSSHSARPNPLKVSTLKHMKYEVELLLLFITLSINVHVLTAWWTHLDH